MDLIWKAVLDGGFVMIPFLILTIGWVIVITSEIIQRPLLKRRAAHLLFPLGFAILAILRVILAFHHHFKVIAMVGPPDPRQYSEDGLVFTRAALILIVAAVATFLPAIYFVGFSPRRLRTTQPILNETRPAEQDEEADAG